MTYFVNAVTNMASLQVPKNQHLIISVINNYPNLISCYFTV